jgi:hypothetical protein
VKRLLALVVIVAALAVAGLASTASAGTSSTQRAPEGACFAVGFFGFAECFPPFVGPHWP